MTTNTRRRPGEVRDAIVTFLKQTKGDASVEQIHAAVEKALGSPVARSSVRSYVQLSDSIERTGRGRYSWRR